MVRKIVAEILHDHVTFELKRSTGFYLNAYVPSLQTGGGVVYFLKTQLGVRVRSTVMVAPMSQRFVEAIERFVKTEGVDLITFEKGQRKDDVAPQYLAERRKNAPLQRSVRRDGPGGDSRRPVHGPLATRSPGRGAESRSRRPRVRR